MLRRALLANPSKIKTSCVDPSSTFHLATMSDSTIGQHRRRSSVKGGNPKDLSVTEPGRREQKSSSSRPSRLSRERRSHEVHCDANDEMESDFSTSDDVELKDINSDYDHRDEDDEETGLTRRERRRNRRRKRRNSRLDVRIVKESKMATVESSLTDQSILKRSLTNVSLIGCW